MAPIIRLAVPGLTSDPFKSDGWGLLADVLMAAVKGADPRAKVVGTLSNGVVEATVGGSFVVVLTPDIAREVRLSVGPVEPVTVGR